jgi:fatty acid desaturase
MNSRNPETRPLTKKQQEALAAELDAIRQRLRAELGERDRRYIHGIVHTQRRAELLARALLFAGALPPAWLAGSALLAVAKILENMEIGHNVMHGQYDWMNEPAFDSQRYEWDNVSPGDEWRHSHNYIHHTFTNIVGKDRDVGYGLLRVCAEQGWSPFHVLQPLAALGLMFIFEWGVALHPLRIDEMLAWRRSPLAALKDGKSVARKAARQLLKDYVVFPLLAGPAAPFVFTGNLAANVMRNVWAFSIIFCGHFPRAVETYPESRLEGESPGQWYERQIRGSANIEGPRWLNILSGHLSHQIEHHLFPDIPAHRYPEIAPAVRDICARYGMEYVTGSFARQLGSVARRIVRHAFPSRPRVTATAVVEATAQTKLAAA